MLVRISKLISGGAAVVAGIVLVLMTAYTLVEITLRGTLGIASNILVEFVGYGLATVTFLGAAQTLRDGSLVRVSLVLRFVPAGLRRVLDVVCLICAMAAISWTAWFVFGDMQRSFSRGYETDSLLPLPLWVPPLGLLVGMLVFLLEMVSWLILVVVDKAELPTMSSEVG